MTAIFVVMLFLPSKDGQQRGPVLRRAPRLCGLLKGVGEPDERWLAESPADEGDADWQSEDRSSRHGDDRIASQRRRLRTAAEVVIAVNQIDGPGRSTRRRHQRIQVELIHNRVDPFLAGEPVVFIQGGKILRIAERSCLLRLQEKLLSEKWQFRAGMLVVEGDNLGERAHWRTDQFGQA